MNIYQPYTYLVKFLPTGQVYYGSSYANNKRKVSNPSQLWVTYFTSSKRIKLLIDAYGKESFSFEVRKVFKTKSETLKWERRVLSKFNAKNNSNWINKSNGANNLSVVKHTEETKQKISKANKGKLHSEESKKKISEFRKGKSPGNKGMKLKPLTKEHKEKLSNNMKGNVPVNKGTPMSSDQKAKIAEAMRLYHQKRSCPATSTTRP
jgi:hypothetical protein